VRGLKRELVFEANFWGKRKRETKKKKKKEEKITSNYFLFS